MTLRRLLKWVAIAGLFLPFQNCSQVGSQVGFNNTPQSAQTCSQGIQTPIPTKFMFLIDISGSTATTDWDRQMREGSISAFLSQYGSQQNFEWSLVTFSDTTSVLTSPAFTSESGMQTALTAFSQTSDLDDTDLALAISTAQSVIANDPDLNSSTKPQYAVLLMTDGMPDLETNVDLVASVKQLVALAPGRITFNTLYFGPYENTTPIMLLDNMAVAGDGHFLNTNANPTGKSFQIQDEINLPSCN